MDTGEGYLMKIVRTDTEDPTLLQEFARQIAAEQNKHPNHGGLFYVGQSIMIFGRNYSVRKVTDKTITIKGGGFRAGQNIITNNSNFRVISSTKNETVLRVLPKKQGITGMKADMVIVDELVEHEQE